MPLKLAKNLIVVLRMIENGMIPRSTASKQDALVVVSMKANKEEACMSLTLYCMKVSSV